MEGKARFSLVGLSVQGVLFSLAWFCLIFMARRNLTLMMVFASIYVFGYRKIMDNKQLLNRLLIITLTCTVGGILTGYLYWHVLRR